MAECYSGTLVGRVFAVGTRTGRGPGLAYYLWIFEDSVRNVVLGTILPYQKIGTFSVHTPHWCNDA